jgi:molecular chaperone GrpE
VTEKREFMPASEPDNHSGTTEKSTNERPDDTVLDPSEVSEDGVPPVNEGEPSGALEDTVEDEDESGLSEVDRLNAELSQLRDDFLRAKADAENARKRAQTEVANARRYALEGFASELLNVRDSLDLARAVDLQQTEGVVESVVEGLELTLRQLDSAFERFSIHELSPEVGDKLDPESHQAMSLIESSDVSPNHIFQVVQKGYRLNDRLLRPARVLVAKAPADESSDG